MTGKITGGQWTVLEHLAAAERAAETVRQTWLPVGGPLDERAVRALEWAGLCRTVPAHEVLRAHAARPPEARAALADESAGCTASDRVRLGHTALDLATAVLAHHLDDEATVPSRSPRHVLFLRMTAFIDRHLHQPDLDPAAVAAAHQISLRYLHRVFQEHGTSVGAYIRQRCLDRCRRDLADPGLRHLTVHAIGARWAFARPADFSRAFRAATGMPPGRYRAAAFGRSC
ncbi:helix-turn-helix domain-containing protein [Streptomyces radiopugnans]|uniref:AraC-type DNA-binding protein n=1 Tax=Streptomyces radiopugnans TaxID=403935 RepID=A0A1H9KJN7_9ACTN|nr:helix-turn-helix domain-containing protein [Streptomyces radiopugnans]SEQ99371.1 AraC-type DNA-binding protein [Streptomyces radiopugnans]